MPKFQTNINNIDKVEHVFAYFSLTLCWLFVSYTNTKRKYIVVIACIIYGIIIELIQSNLTIYRTGDYLDVLANSFGAVLGLLIFNQIFKKNQFN